MTVAVARMRDLVTRLEPRDERERRARERILAELRRLPRPLDETADRTHVTGSAVVVSASGVLLHRHKRLGRWLQPGGHVDPGELPQDTAVRETLEETGVAAQHVDADALLHVDVHDGGRGHVHLDLRWLLVAPAQEPTPPPGESQVVGWFPLERARRLADPGLIGVLDHPAVLTAAGR